MDRPPLSFASAEGEFASLEQQRQAGQLTDQAYKERLNALRIKDDEGHTWMLQERSGAWHVYRSGAWVQATPPGRETAGPIGAPPPPAPAAVAPPVAARSEPPVPLPPVYATPPVTSTTPVYPTAPPAYQPAPPAYQAVPPAYPAPVQPAAYPPPPPAAAYPLVTPDYTPAAEYIAPVQPIVPEKDPRSARTRRREARRLQASNYRPGCIKITWSILKWEILWGALGWLTYDMLGQRYPWVLIPVALLALLTMVLYIRRFRRPAIEGAL